MDYAIICLIAAIAIVIAIRPPPSRPGRLPVKVSTRRDDTPPPSAALTEWRQDAAHGCPMCGQPKCRAPRAEFRG